MIICDTLTSDTWWAGQRLGDRERHGTQLVTKGAGMQAQGELEGAMHAATENLVRAGMPLLEAILTHWDEWKSGVPAK